MQNFFFKYLFGCSVYFGGSYFYATPKVSTHRQTSTNTTTQKQSEKIKKKTNKKKQTKKQVITTNT